MTFKNKTAIITGATSGIGRSVAQALHQSGSNLILNGRDATRGKELKELGPQVIFEQGDVKEPQLNQRLVDKAMENFGQLDSVVLAAGQLGIGRLDQLSIEDWQDTIATNLSAVFYLLKHAIPALQKQSGSVVIIGSVAALHAFPEHPAYTASKGALPALVKQLARDYGPSVRINMISPAQVLTPLLKDSVRAFEHPETILQETADGLPMKRLGLPQDITNMVLYLLSDKAGWITGSNMVVDGGFLST